MTPLWAFIVFFPVLMGGPVLVPVSTIGEAHCKHVRKLFTDQLPRPTNIVISDCRPMKITIEETS